jgi:DNA-binding NarL/FixJ family response regulator
MAADCLPWFTDFDTVPCMSTRVAVAGSSPTWRRGMGAVLGEAGYHAVTLRDLNEWSLGLGGSAVVAGIDEDADLDAVHYFSLEHPHIPVIAVITELTLTSFAEAIRQGSTAVIDEDDPTEAIVLVLASALEGRPAVPQHLLRALAQLVPDARDAESWLDPTQVSWLRAMARGVTVAELAQDIGYSERAMFRNLKNLYIRIGVRNRTEALLWASRHGLLTS